DQAAARAAAVTARIAALLVQEGSLEPDFLILFDRTGRPLWTSPASPVEAAEVSELGPTFRVRNGERFHNRVFVHRGRGYQLIGVPIRGVDVADPAAASAVEEARDRGDVVGGLLLGTDLTRYMQQYKLQSDDREQMQHRLALISDGRVVASVVPQEQWAELAESLSQKDWRFVDDGEYRQPVVRFGGGAYDLATGPVDGFRGLDVAPVGELFLLRSRANLVGRGARIPWTEIVIGLVLAVVIASLLAVWITRPIKRFVAQSQQILEGETDLTQRISLNSRDETQDLAENINRVFARLYELASEVQGAAFQVGASSAEISAASKQMAGGLRDQTFKIESSTAAVTELSASIQQVASNAADATQMAEKSNQSVTAAVARMQEIREAVEDAADKMRELGESSKRIGNIVEVIRQISEQTSLLALNASIEAAHAGEQGRGFAVVADEVSSLARRVGQSAKDIETLIQTIKEQTAEAVQSMQAGTREVEGGTSLVTTTLTDLTSLIAVVKDTAGAVQEQAVVSDEIARNMDAVQTIAAEMLAGSEESVAQSEQLHSLAFQLEQSVGGFNLDASGPARGSLDSSMSRRLGPPEQLGTGDGGRGERAR
ncbi:methyl-accepting chemotaxis protein, partial [Haliangium sp.]|uniref:methyl-accepting chemotaxis protein n=1 Tax=Haliangium sp. TaxID=2663208 RepID=UPI003D101BDC